MEQRKRGGAYRYPEKESPVLSYIYAYLERSEIKTIKQFCADNKINISDIYRLANGQAAPYTDRGKIQITAGKLTAILGVGLAELFPRYECKLSQDDSDFVNIEEYFSSMSYPSTENIYEERDLFIKILVLIESRLTAREFYVFFYYSFGLLRFTELGNIFNFSTNYARVLYRQAIEKISYFLERKNITPDNIDSFLTNEVNKDSQTVKLLEECGIFLFGEKQPQESVEPPAPIPEPGPVILAEEEPVEIEEPPPPPRPRRPRKKSQKRSKIVEPEPVELERQPIQSREEEEEPGVLRRLVYFFWGKKR